MKISHSLLFRSFFTFFWLAMMNALSADDADPGTLTPQLIERIRKNFEWNAGDRARFNAVTNGDINALALNREKLGSEDDHFSHRIKTSGVTNQKASGRCWMFAGLNVVRPQIISERQLKDFQFSASYLQFWDKMEKANLYLENVIELRDRDFLDREWEILHKWALSDGGWWNYVTGLIEKYGVVPSEVMPETNSSNNTQGMNHVLELILRAAATEILDEHAQNATEDQLRAMKKRVLVEVYRFLVINLGEPPSEFEWRYQTKEENTNRAVTDDETSPSESEVEEKGLSAREKFTPHTFYRDVVGVPLKEFVCLYHDPKQSFNEHFKFERSKNIVGAQDMHFVNVEMHQMRDIARKSIIANEPVWFAANVGVDQSKQHGLMADRLFDYDTLFGIKTRLSKAERTRFPDNASNHAMVLIGVDLRENQPVKWLVENSWGSKNGNDGYWTMHNDWFEENVYTIIVHRSHVPARILQVFDQDPTSLPSWYPGALGVR